MVDFRMEDRVFLAGAFQLYPECKKPYHLRLDRKNLTCEENLNPTTYTKLSKGSRSVSLSDVVSAKLFDSKIKDDLSAYFQIIAYVMPNSAKNKKGKRKRQILTFRVKDSEDFDENMMIAETWARTIEWLISDPFIKMEDLEVKETFPPKKRILVLINPKSGNGASYAKFRKFAEPLFKDAGIFYQEITTRAANHGMDIVYELDLEKWDGIAICSGDGLAYEVIQGLMQRDDWEDAIKMPIGMIPTGSGNALCASVLYAANDVFDITSAAFHVVRGRPYPIDLCSIQNTKQRMFAFLSVTWGIISDIDIESERFRLLGNARFTAGAVYRILALRIYDGKISYIPSEKQEGETEKEKEEDWPEPLSVNMKNRDTDSSLRQDVFESIPENEEIRKDGLNGEAATTPLSSKATIMGYNVEVEKSTVEDKTGQKGQSVKKRHKSIATSVFRKDGKYQHFDENSDEVQINTNHWREKRAFSTVEFGNDSTATNMSGIVPKRVTRPLNGPTDILLPRIDEHVPANWVTVEGEFVTVIVMMISHLGSNLITCPELQLGDGEMELLFVKKGISRKSLIDILTKMETGDHVSVKELEVRKIKAFRIEPGVNKTGYLAIDGEAVDYGVIQGQLHKGMARVLLSQ